MTRHPVDVESLAIALDKKRAEEGISWRRLAYELKLSPSTLTRLRNGQAPDTSALLALTGWLGMALEEFTARQKRASVPEPDLVAQLVPLLRARSDLEKNDVEMLEDIIQAAYRRIKSRKANG